MMTFSLIIALGNFHMSRVLCRVRKPE